MTNKAFNARHGVSVGTTPTDVIDSSGNVLTNAATASKLLNSRTISLSGDVVASGTFDGSGNLDLSTTIQANSVALGTDTTGNYMVDVAAGTGVSVSHTQSEGSTATVSIGQAVGTSDSPTFADLTLTGQLKGPANFIIDPAAVGDNTGKVVIKGDLQIDGTTTTINSTTITLDDVVLTLGGDTAPTTDDTYDRGIEYKWYDTQARVGFFGFDRSTGKLTFIPQSTVSSGAYSGTKGEVDAYLDWSNVLNKPTIDNTTYDILAVAVAGGAYIRLHGSSGTTDDIKLVSSGGTTISYTDDNSIAISSTAVGDGTLSAAAGTAGLTNTTVALNFSGAYSANATTNRTINPVVGPALTALATLMTSGSTGFIKRTGVDTYSIDTNTYLTSYTESDTLDSVTGRGATTANNITLTGGTLYLNNASSNTLTANIDGVGLTVSTKNSATTNGGGGLLRLLAGSGNALGTGGNILITAGAGGASNGMGGSVSINSGAGNGTNSSGSITLASGSAGATGTSGIASLGSGSGGSTSGNSGSVFLSSGSTTNGTSGNVNISAGSATIGIGGNVNITGGDTNSATQGGNVTVAGGPASTSTAGTAGQLTLRGGISNSTTTSGTGGTVYVSGGSVSSTNAITKNGGHVYVDGGGSGANGTINYGNVYIGNQANGTTYGTANVYIGKGAGTNVYIKPTTVAAGLLKIDANGLVSSDTTAYLSGTVGVANGGTGITTYAAGDILYASATNTLSKLAKGTDGQVLKLASGLPVWSTDNDTIYSLPTATASVLGGIKLGDGTTQTVAANAVTTTASRTYAVQLNASNQAVVNVPWVDTDTVYSLPTATASVLGGIKLGDATTQTVAANAVTTTASRTYAVQLNASNQAVVNIPWTDTTYTVGSGTLGVSIGAAGATNTTVTWNTSTGFNANSTSNYTYDLKVGPALTALATLMTSGSTGFIKRTGVDTYSIDTNTYLTSYSETDTLATVTNRGNTTTASIYTPAGAGNGYGFWSTDTYSIKMASASDYFYGPVTDYSIKMSMSNNAGRGFTWGVYGSVPVAALEVTTGNMQIKGSFAAASKSFLIDHPTKPGWKLRYGSLEGPENGVYVRGKLKGNKIELPDYWTKLVDPDSITVTLTPIGKHQKLYVEDISNNVVTVGNDGLFAGEINCFYVVYGERVDVDKIVVEYAE